jgi:hypothetical protein
MADDDNTKQKFILNKTRPDLTTSAPNPAAGERKKVVVVKKKVVAPADVAPKPKAPAKTAPEGTPLQKGGEAAARGENPKPAELPKTPKPPEGPRGGGGCTTGENG